MSTKFKDDPSLIKIIQIMGSNGSGKTSLVKQLGELSESWTYLEGADGKVIATIFDDIRYVAIGKYAPDACMGGCDGMPTVDSIKKAILQVRRQYPDHWIVFEGMMISTIRTTFYDFITTLAEHSHGKVEAKVVVLKATVEGCMERIYGRGSAKPDLKVENVKAKCDLVIRNGQSYDADVVRWIDVDHTAVDAMLGEFLWEVYDFLMIDAIWGTTDL